MIGVKRACRQLHKRWSIGRWDTLALAGHMSAGALSYYLNPCSPRTSRKPLPDHEAIRRDLESAGVEVVPYRIDVAAFDAWLDEVFWPEHYVEQCGEVFREKALEHYVGAQLLEMQAADVLIDVAAATSPWRELSERRYGCTTYSLDLAFPRGVHGKKIGADATQMPVPESWASKLALHCAFEVFEGNADMAFIPEAERVLKLGGRMVILPLYLHDTSHIDSSPLSDRRGLDYESAQRVWRDDGWIVRFSRKYSAASFVERVVSQVRSMNLKIFTIENEKDVSPACYLKFAALFEKGDAGEEHDQV